MNWNGETDSLKVQNIGLNGCLNIKQTEKAFSLKSLCWVYINEYYSNLEHDKWLYWENEYLQKFADTCSDLYGTP